MMLENNLKHAERHIRQFLSELEASDPEGTIEFIRGAKYALDIINIWR